MSLDRALLLSLEVDPPFYLKENSALQNMRIEWKRRS